MGQINIGVSNVARNVKQPSIGVGGVARKVTNGYVGVGGVARQIYKKALVLYDNGVTDYEWTGVSMQSDYMYNSSSSQTIVRMYPAIDLTPYTKVCVFVEDELSYPAYTSFSMSAYVDGIGALGTQWKTRSSVGQTYTFEITIDKSLLTGTQHYFFISAGIMNSSAVSRQSKCHFKKIWLE